VDVSTAGLLGEGDCNTLISFAGEGGDRVSLSFALIGKALTGEGDRSKLFFAFTGKGASVAFSSAFASERGDVVLSICLAGEGEWCDVSKGGGVALFFVAVGDGDSSEVVGELTLTISCARKDLDDRSVLSFAISGPACSITFPFDRAGEGDRSVLSFALAGDGDRSILVFDRPDEVCGFALSLALAGEGDRSVLSLDLAGEGDRSELGCDLKGDGDRIFKVAILADSEYFDEPWKLDVILASSPFDAIVAAVGVALVSFAAFTDEGALPRAELSLIAMIRFR
jgi:hypothetical protein